MFSDAATAVRQRLARGPLTSRALQEQTGLSQPTVSRALAALSRLGGELLRSGAGRSTIYSLVDSSPDLPPLAVQRVDGHGRLARLGLLTPLRPAGFAMQRDDGATQFSEGLPWWLADLRPQGFLGRALALRHGAALGLPPSINDWSDRHVLRALAAFGDDAVGNLLLGDAARDRFLGAETPSPITAAERPAAYAALAARALQGELAGSSAGGEQPKFTAFAHTAAGPTHVLVKFSLAEAHPVAARWRDLLLAEHLALQTLRDSGLQAARSTVLEHGLQRFLELERFDRVGTLGRRALHSLGCLDDEFVGDRSAPWPVAVRALAARGVVQPEACAAVEALYAFGTLIGNSDMHMGNLSFLGDDGPPCALAPAYDMLPMAFAPTAAGALRDELPPLRLPPAVALTAWPLALERARAFMARVQSALEDGALSTAFRPCADALAARLSDAARQVGRIAA